MSTISETLTYLGDRIVYVAAIVAALGVLAATVPRFFHWYVDRFKRQNRAWHEFLIKELYEKSFQPYFIIESKSLDCTFTNAALRRLFVSGDEAFEGKAWFRLVDPAELPGVTKAWREAFDNRSNYTNITTMVLPDGTRLRMHVTAEPFVYAAKVRAFVGTVKVLK